MKTIKSRIFTLLSLSAAWLPSASIQAQDIDLTGYTLTFSDEFNTSPVSVATTSPKGASKWYYWPPYGAAGGYSDSVWNAAAFSASGGILTNLCWWDAGTSRWQSGNLSSMDPTGAGFAQQYGYFVVRAKMPNAGQGAWPGFWLMTQNSIPNNAGKRLEIDVFEWYGSTLTSTPGLIQQATHNWNNDGSQGPPSGLYSPYTTVPGGTPPSTYKNYGCLVTPTTITWYIDGIQTNQIATPAEYLTNPMYLMLEYALGGGWTLTGAPFNTKGSSALLVDWVRVYALPTGSSVLATATSYQAGYEPSKAVDNDGATMWHSQWNPLLPLPQSITLDRGSVSSVSGLTYLPRQGGGNGVITAYKVHVSTNGVNYTTVINNGSWAGDATQKTASWPAVSARYVRLEATAGNGNLASAASVTLTTGGGSVVYNDSFTRTAALGASAPDVTMNGNTWVETVWGGAANNALAPNGSKVVSVSPSVQDGGVLAVNGTSGVVLNGTANFTLSADFVNPSTGTVDLYLGNSNNGLVNLNLGSGTSVGVIARKFGTAVGWGNNNYNGTVSNTLTLSYSAATGLITFMVNGAPINVYSGSNTLAVTPAELSALTKVGFMFEYNGATASLDNFKLTF